MSGQLVSKVFIMATLSLGLAACGPTLVSLTVVNNANAVTSSDADETYCSDELRATLVWGAEQVEVAAAPGEGNFANTYSGRGDVTVEARCYREGQEVGYIQLQRGLRSSSLPDVFVFPPGEEGQVLDDTTCETPDTSRGVPLSGLPQSRLI